MVLLYVAAEGAAELELELVGAGLRTQQIDGLAVRLGYRSGLVRPRIFCLGLRISPIEIDQRRFLAGYFIELVAGVLNIAGRLTGAEIEEVGGLLLAVSDIELRLHRRTRKQRFKRSRHPRGTDLRLLASKVWGV